jgi:hypothetical protein
MTEKPPNYKPTPVPSCTKLIDGETYWVDADGRLVPESMVKEVDKLRDMLVRDKVGWALQEREQLRHGKAQIFEDVQAFVDLSAERYGVKARGSREADKRGITLYSFDGKFKLVRKSADLIRFDEGLQAAKALIDEYLDDLTTGAKPELKAFVRDVFEVDKDGKLNTGRVLSLRRYDIEDPRWKQAMLAINEAAVSIGTASYINLYERIGSSDEWALISLDFASA